MRYIALGDSISIDDYPQRETGRSGLGAASLFYRNDDEFWPEFAGRDLSKLHRGVTFQNFTADGTTSEDVLRFQLPRVTLPGEQTIVTVTAGGNDILLGLADGVIKRIERIVQRLEPSLVLLGTVYDPSDGTYILYGERLDREAKWLAQFNDAVRNIAASRKHVRLIDIHRHFLGHGVTAPERERWYWSELIFEPNARGASEVRRLWLDALP